MEFEKWSDKNWADMTHAELVSTGAIVTAPNQFCGDITFTAGTGPNLGGEQKPYGGNIIFQRADGTEDLRLNADGSFLVAGVAVAGPEDVRGAFVTWLRQCGLLA